MKDTQQRNGFLNRNVVGLPKDPCNMKIIVNDSDGESEHLCSWMPFDKSKYDANNMPSDGHLGTATIIEDRHRGIGFHAWEQNNHEFIFYSIV